MDLSNASLIRWTVWFAFDADINEGMRKYDRSFKIVDQYDLGKTSVKLSESGRARKIWEM